MKTIPEALKDLYVAMGGDAADVADISLTPDMIEALADVYEGGGGGGAEIFTATFTGTPDPEDPKNFNKITWESDKTYSEIGEAFENGKIMRGKGTVIGLGIDVYMTTYAVLQNNVSFTGVGLTNGSVVYLQAGVSSDDTAFGYIIPISSLD